jgi:O-methyltransferase domain/Dimerisation domain
MKENIAADRHTLVALTNGFMTSQAIHAFTSLGLADLIGSSPRTAAELAATTATNPLALRRLLSALAAVGILDEDDQQAFALTPLGDGLRTDAPGSVAGWVSLIGTPNFWQNWGQLADSVRTGETGWRLRHGVDAWTYREQHPEDSRIFDQAMVSLTSTSAEGVASGYDFSRFPAIVDVGGGLGMLLAGILARNPAAKGVLFDQPHVVDRAEDFLRG